MDKESVLKIINKFKVVLQNKGIVIEKLVLYGSYANLTYTTDSDIDLVIVSDSFKDKDYWERLDVISDAICEVFEPIEAVGLTLEEWNNKAYFVVEYAQNGQMV